MLRQGKPKSISRRVGLDIGSHTINGVEVVERGSDIIVRSAGAVAIPGMKSKHDIPDPGAVSQALKNLWVSSRFVSKQVVLALPPDAVYMKWLHLEASDRDELDATARAAAVRGAPFPAEEAIVDYRVLSWRGSGSRHVYLVMLVAASGLAVDGLLDIVESAGLEPVAVDVGAAAALRSFDAQKRNSSALWSGQPLAHCIVGARNTTIVVVRGGNLEFARTVPVGGNDFTECIAERCEIEWTEADRIKTTPGNRLVQGGTLITSTSEEELRVPCENIVGRLTREIQRSLRFFTSQFAEGSYLGMIGSATMSGGGALLKGLDSCIQDQGIEVTGAINPFAGLLMDSEGGGVQHISEAAPQYATAVGLAVGDYWSGAGQANAVVEIAA